MKKYIRLHYVALIVEALVYLSAEGRLEKFSTRIKFWSNPTRRPTTRNGDGVVGRDRDNLTSHGERPSTVWDFGTPDATMKRNVSIDAPSNSVAELPISFSFDPGREIKERDLRSDPKHSLSSLNSVTSAILVALQDSVTVERCRKVVCWVGAYWLMKKILKEMSTILDEMQEEILKEDHDNLLFKPETVAQASTSIIRPLLPLKTNDNRKESITRLEENQQQQANAAADKTLKSRLSKNEANKSKVPYDPKPSKVPKLHMTHKIQYARNLILKLHAAGLPLETHLYSEDGTSLPSTDKTAESVLRSLTKLEGSLLANCLLIPEKEGVNASAAVAVDPMEEWNNIGGLADVKEALMDLIWPLTTYRQQHHKTNCFGDLLSHPFGVLLYGPPGCGKTLLAKSLAFTAGARFLCVRHSDLQRKYYGDTNLRVRALFSLARKVQPCIIFVDEVDGLFRERYSGGSGGEEHDASRDLKTEFMQLWDGISSSKSDKILVMGATNRPFDVDAAFLRRMPRSFFVGLPDLSARIYILQNMLKGVPLSPDFDIEMIACQTQGYSPSDLKELLRVAVLAPLREARAISSKLSLGTGLHSSPPNIAQIRALHPSDVIKARRVVSPTQYSAAYRSAIAEYVSRNQGTLNPTIDDVSNKECSDTDDEEISEPLSEGEGMSSFDDD